MKAIRNNQGLFKAGVRENGHEFIASETRELVRSPERGFDPFREVDQNLVALEMAMRVIDLLEVVQIEQHDRQRVAMPFGMGNFPFELLHRRMLVEALRQTVVATDEFQVLPQFLGSEHD